MEELGGKGLARWVLKFGEWRRHLGAGDAAALECLCSWMLDRSPSTSHAGHGICKSYTMDLGQAGQVLKQECMSASIPVPTMKLKPLVNECSILRIITRRSSKGNGTSQLLSLDTARIRDQAAGAQLGGVQLGGHPAAEPSLQPLCSWMLQWTGSGRGPGVVGAYTVVLSRAGDILHKHWRDEGLHRPERSLRSLLEGSSLFEVSSRQRDGRNETHVRLRVEQLEQAGGVYPHSHAGQEHSHADAALHNSYDASAGSYDDGYGEGRRWVVLHDAPTSGPMGVGQAHQRRAAILPTMVSNPGYVDMARPTNTNHHTTGSPNAASLRLGANGGPMFAARSPLHPTRAHHGCGGDLPLQWRQPLGTVYQLVMLQAGDFKLEPCGGSGSAPAPSAYHQSTRKRPIGEEPEHAHRKRQRRQEDDIGTPVAEQSARRLHQEMVGNEISPDDGMDGWALGGGDVRRLDQLYPDEPADAGFERQSWCGSGWEVNGDGDRSLDRRGSRERGTTRKELRIFLDALPSRVASYIKDHDLTDELLEVVLDAGRDVRLRLMGQKRVTLEGVVVPVKEALRNLHRLKSDEAGYARPRSPPSMSELSRMFQVDSNRMALPKLLHRISAIRDMEGKVAGITYRVGRHIAGVAAVVEDILWSSCCEQCGGGLLLIGPPGTGKTTLLRDVVSMLAGKCDREVVVVDTSNEIAGDGSIPHPCIGNSRRLMVPQREQQYKVLLEAVQNTTPDVVVCDEISSQKEVASMRTTSQRGVAMVATVHGTGIPSLLKNHELNLLLGGVEAVTLGDTEARASNRGVKTRLERKGAPAFTAAVEVLATDRWRVHRSVSASVDALLSGQPLPTELRWRGPKGEVLVQFETPGAARMVQRAARGLPPYDADGVVDDMLGRLLH